MITSNQKETALYCRLSQDDNTENESNSIQTQKMILQRFAAERHFPDPCFYVDDGYSGASFQRPGFQQMMADMENGEIGIIITKDLSRLGRNQLHTGPYIEERFPMFGVRYIAINDNVDTDSSESNELMPFKNLFNEWYVRDSSRKVRAVFRAKAERGERLGAKAPYGYRRSEDDRNRLVVDEEAAAMLENEAYLGNTVNMRYSTKSYKDKRRITHPREECLVFEGTHPALVTREVWNIVQRVRQKKRRPTKMKEQEKLTAEIPAKESAIQKLRDTVSSTGGFIAKAKRYTNITELTPELLRLFIRKIVVHEKSVKYSKYSEQTAEIHYTNIGFIGETREEEKPQQEITA